VSQRFTIIGFTEAELGFIAALLLFVVLISRGDPSSPNEDLKREVDSLKARIDSLMDQPPTCSQRGLIDGYLADVTLPSQGVFVVAGRDYSALALRKRFDGDLKQAKQRNCVHQIRVFVCGRADANAFATGLRELQQMFYIKYEGVKDC